MDRKSMNFEERMYGAVGTDDCHQVGILGGCGVDCWVYLEGRCLYSEEMEPRLETEEDKIIYMELYKNN